MLPMSVRLQFESKQISADELERYLRTASEEANVSEAQALAKADQGMYCF